MLQHNKNQIFKHKLLAWGSLIIIFFSTNIANAIVYHPYYGTIDDMDSIRYQISLIIICIIISINSCCYLYMYTKPDKNNLDT